MKSQHTFSLPRKIVILRSATVIFVIRMLKSRSKTVQLNYILHDKIRFWNFSLSPYEQLNWLRVCVVWIDPKASNIRYRAFACNV